MSSASALRIKNEQWRAANNPSSEPVLPVSPSFARYLDEFTNAWRRIRGVVAVDQLAIRLRESTMVLVGDYHALPASQRYVANLMRTIAGSGTHGKLVLALECFYSSHQLFLDQWWHGQIDAERLLARTGFDRHWGYAPEPYFDMLLAARQWSSAVYGLDLDPAQGGANLNVRDRHFARQLTALRQQFPDAQIVGLLGECHLAPTHLPALLQRQLPDEKILLLFQNLDPIYQQVVDLQGRPCPVRLASNAYCVFTAHPSEKYEHFRRYLEQRLA